MLLKQLAWPMILQLWFGLAFAQNDPKALLPDHLVEFLNYEQKHMSTSVDRTRINMGDGNLQDPLYAPENGNVFQLESYWIDESKMHSFPGDGLSAKIKKQLFRKRNGQRQVRFFVHPESKEFYGDLILQAEAAPAFFATATSSSRSLLVWNESTEPFIAKVSLNKEVSAVVRTIPLSEVARSVGTNNVLVQAAPDLLPTGFDWLKETYSSIPKGMPRGGMIIRELPKKRMIPLFALYGGDSSKQLPLLAQMIQKSGESPVEFIEKRIIQPFSKIWVSSVFDLGLTMEAHAQNTLLELDEDGLPNGRYVFRDLGGFNVDFDYRRRMGISDPSFLPVIENFKKEYHLAEIPSALNASLFNFYDGGFLFNLNKDLPLWMDQGWIPKQDLEPIHFTRLLRKRIRAELKLRGVERLPEKYHLNDLADVVIDTRLAVIQAKEKGTQPDQLGMRLIQKFFSQLAQSCGRMFRPEY